MLSFSLSPSEFRATHFEKAALVCRSAVPAHAFSWADLDATLDSLEPTERSLQLFQGGLVPQQQYTREAVELGRMRRRLDHSPFYARLESGATLVLNRFEDHAPLARCFCAEVARYVGWQTSANAYVSFGGTGTFGEHWDTHDVFAIQLLGRKRWQLFAPTFPLPLSQHASERAAQRAPAAATLDVVLEPGDMLYVPRGWWHSVIPFQEGSCHVSVGAYAATVYDYLQWVCSQFLAQQPLARRSFPAALEEHAALRDVLHRLVDVALDAGVIRRFSTELERAERHHGALNLALHLGPRMQLTGDVRLQLTMSCTPALDGGTLILNGAAHRLEPVGFAIVAALRDGAFLSFDALCERIGAISRDVVSATVLNLARHEVIRIDRAFDIDTVGGGDAVRHV